MRDNVVNTNVIQLKPNFLWFLTLTYAMVIILANWFDPRLIKVFGLTTDAGTLIFPLTFLLSDLITEVYGYKHARRAIWCGFLFSVLAFYGTMNNVNLLYLMLTMWFIKVVIEFLGLPISIRLAKKLKTLETLDIYDKRTNFNLFSLEAIYTEKDNQFAKIEM